MGIDLRGRVFAVLAVGALCACGGSIGSAGGGSSGGADAGGDSSPSGGDANGGGSSTDADAEAGRVPLQHRPSDAQCSGPAPTGDCASPGPPPGGCTSDNSCTAGTNGRCINHGGGPAADCFCTYDTCVHDTDCASGLTCACHGSPYTDSADNTCMPGNCRIDADCGAGGYCSPSSLPAACGDSLAGYYCHTAKDLCTDDSDCQATGPNLPA